MAEEKKTSKATEPVKVGRGIGTARGTNRLKFSDKDAKPNGLFLGHIESVEVREVKIGEDTTGMPSFNGLTIPRLVINFASNEKEPNRRKYTNLTFNAQESNIETIPGGSKAWTVDSIFNWMKHLLDVFVTKGLRELNDEEIAALTLPFDDVDEEGNYVSVEPETVVEGWKTLFENFASIMNTGNNGNPVFMDANKKPITIWMKLLRYVKGSSKKNATWKKVNNGELALPNIVGEGCIEIFKQNVAPAIRLNPITESIIPRKEAEAKTPNVGIPGGINSGIPVADPMLGGGVDPMDDMFTAAAEDMPFDTF